VGVLLFRILMGVGVSILRNPSANRKVGAKVG
jgi:hypothetical protein